MSDNEFREAMLHIIKRIEVGVDQLHAKIDRLDAKIDQKTDQLNTKIDQKTDQLNTKIDQKTDQLDAKIDQLAAETNRKFERLEASIKANRDEINRIGTELKLLKWMMGLGVPLIAALIPLFLKAC